MTKYLMLGMSLPDVIAGATSKPAEMLGRGWDERIGSLGIGCGKFKIKRLYAVYSYLF